MTSDAATPTARRPNRLALLGAATSGLLLLLAGVALAQDHAEVSSDVLGGLLHGTTRAIEIAGIAVILIGGIAATGLYLKRLMAGDGGPDSFKAYRSSVGQAILLGLEFLVAADIIGTVAIEPTLDSLAVLAGIVLIRTFLSFSLEVEIDGRLPWRKADAEKAAS
ncbi:DUF1622 domain-containing protein [Mongoliimonas terrestris]|uniref:DUF1622 domain-containing protein n=1 Tax=Mongoliimonas terrestris TaxID=1709001 RepID=UPI0009F8D739|nr:DUF1622 domain-containing protein [Mongoliimonas terrestris]